MRPLSSTTAAIEESRTLILTNEARRLKTAGVDIISLTAGEPDFPTPREAKQAAHRAIDEDFTRYTPTEGIPELVDAVRGKFVRENGLQFSPEQILVSAGAKQSVFNALQALCSPGDEVLFFSPYWVSYPALVQLARGVPVPVHPASQNGFRPDLDRLRGAVTPRTVAILLNTPCNPTGDVLTADELGEIASVAKRHDLAVISDEVYERLVYNGRRHISIGTLPGMDGRVITVSSVSKSHAMPGWRIGYMGGPRDVVAAATKVQGHMTTCNNSVAQKAALAALTGPQEEMERMVVEFQRRRDLVHRLLGELPGLDPQHPEGAMFFFLNVRSFARGHGDGSAIPDDEDIAAYLLREHRIAVVPGSSFGEPGHLRLSFSSTEPVLREGISRLITGLKSLQERPWRARG